MTDIAELVKTLRANDFDDAADRIEALQAEVDRQVSKNLIDLVRHREDADRRVAEEREACATVADEQERTFLSPEYAVGQPHSSFAERFACRRVASAIRSRSNGAQVERLSQPSPLTGASRLASDLLTLAAWRSTQTQFGWAHPDCALLQEAARILKGEAPKPPDDGRGDAVLSQPSPAPDGWQDQRIAILEDRIRYAIDLVDGGYVGEATYELDRALNDPDMLASAPPAPSQPSPVVTVDALTEIIEQVVRGAVACTGVMPSARYFATVILAHLKLSSPVSSGEGGGTGRMSLVHTHSADPSKSVIVVGSNSGARR